MDITLKQDCSSHITLVTMNTPLAAQHIKIFQKLHPEITKWLVFCNYAGVNESFGLTNPLYVFVRPSSEYIDELKQELYDLEEHQGLRNVGVIFLFCDEKLQTAKFGASLTVQTENQVSKTNSLFYDNQYVYNHCRHKGSDEIKHIHFVLSSELIQQNQAYMWLSYDCRSFFLLEA